MREQPKKPHRFRKRVPFNAPIILLYEDREYVFEHTYDVSMNGAFVKTAQPLAEGATGVFRFILSAGMRREVVSGDFLVIRDVGLDAGLSGETPGAGMGLKFTNIDDESSELLYQVIKYNQKSS